MGIVVHDFARFGSEVLVRARKKRVSSNHFSHGHDSGHDHGQVDGHGVGPKFWSKNLDRNFGTEFLGPKFGVGPEQVLIILGRLESGMTIWIIII